MKITVIGGGPGGYEAAIYAAKMGAQVTLVEKANVGGTCLNVGCIPTKALLAATDVLHTVHKAKDFGITVEGPVTQDFAAVVARKDNVVAGLVKGVEMTLKANGVELIKGHGTLKDKNTVSVKAADGAETEVKTDYVILATGSVPTKPGFLPIDGEKIITSDEVLSLSATPKSMIIVGGGVIGCEIGQFLSRCGTEVTIVELLPHILPFEDDETAKALARQFRKDKIKTICGKGIATVERTADGVKATLNDDSVLEAEYMLVSVGRSPYTDNLGLESVGIATDRGRVPVNENLRTSVDNIFAIGDIVDSPQLAHVATKEGFVAVDNIMGASKTVPYHAVPRCVYTEPEVASVGVTEEGLQKEGKAYKAGRFDFTAIGKAKAVGKTDGFVKVFVDEKDILIGAVIVGAHATDMLQVLTMGVDRRMTAEEMGDCIFPHPTMCEGIMEALHDVHGMSVHKI